MPSAVAVLFSSVYRPQPRMGRGSRSEKKVGDDGAPYGNVPEGVGSP